MQLGKKSSTRSSIYPRCSSIVRHRPTGLELLKTAIAKAGYAGKEISVTPKWAVQEHGRGQVRFPHPTTLTLALALALGGPCRDPKSHDAVREVEWKLLELQQMNNLSRWRYLHSQNSGMVLVPDHCK
ncbi:hypothetical protein L1987_12699 [Smallanthus sonchifolius]|uniref:Uncharacterized protein n=1 Tax=Smallanthus sonchifolius TaxID=185202 RepID=A0ACB9JG18_9ASTR|nr:hypothetical protein L1987_12699 [Smallanthus sonchifolius]